MDDKSLYAAILGLKEPWGIERVELRLAEGEVHVWVALPPKTLWVCPECHAPAPIHDHRERQWRHLDTGQYRTLVHARIPRLACPTHGTRQLLELIRFGGDPMVGAERSLHDAEESSTVSSRISAAADRTRAQGPHA